jgi:hypothetical protein
MTTRQSRRFDDLSSILDEMERACSREPDAALALIRVSDLVEQARDAVDELRESEEQ